jgi:hypothetical protein
MNGPTDPQSPLAKLRADYIGAKLLSDETTLEQFSDAPQAVRDTLLSKGRAKGVITEQTTDEMFYSMWSTDPVKKKDQPEVAPSVSVADGEETSAASPSISDAPLIDSGTPAPDVVEPLAPEVQQPMSARVAMPPEPIPSLSKEIMSVVAPKEKPYFNPESSFGQALNSMGGVGEFIDDIGRAYGQGRRQGAVVDDAIKVMTQGEKATDEDIKNLIAEIKAMDELGPSDEFKEFQKIAGQGGVFNFLRAVATQPQALPEVFTQSMASMVNPVTVTTTLPVVVPSLAMGGPAGALASLPYAMAAAGGALETALTFTEVLKEELGEQPFTEDNVRALLSDEKFMKKARTKAVVRGGIIGVVDGISAKVGIKVGKEMIAARKTKRELVGVTTGVEGGFGAGGEAIATTAVGDELKAVDMGLEGIVGATTAPITVAATYAKKPKYKINGQDVDRDFIFDFLDNATEADLREVDIKVDNDEAVSAELKRRVRRSQIAETLDPRATDEQKKNLLDLEEERDRLQGTRDTRSKKRRVAAIDEEIDKIQQAISEGGGPVFVASADFTGDSPTFFSARYEGDEFTGTDATDPETQTEPDQTEPEERSEADQTEAEEFTESDQTEGPGPRSRKDKDASSKPQPEPKVEPVTRAKREEIMNREGMFIGRKGTFGKIRDGFEKARRKTLSNRKFLPKTVQEMKEILQGRRKATERRVLRTVKDVDNLIKTIPTQDLLGQLDLFDRALRGEKNIEGLDVRLAASAGELRAEIDALSYQLINEGLVSAQAKEVIEKNVGEYLNRSYMIFDDKKFTPSDAVRQEAKNYFIGKLRGRPDLINEYIAANPEQFQGMGEIEARESAISQLADNKIFKILSKDESFVGKNAFGRYGVGEKSTNPLLKRNEDLAPQVRALMGERVDPLANYARTVMNLDFMVEKGKMMKAIGKLGEGVFLFKRGMQPEGMERFSTTIQSNENAAFDPLKGLETSPELADALRFLNEQPAERSFLARMYLKTVSTVKWSNTVGNLVTHARNVIGNFGFVVSNGHFNLLSTRKTFQTMFGQSKAENQQRMDRLIELGVVNQDTNVGEIRSMFDAPDLEKAVIDRLNDRNANLYEKILKSPKKGVELISNLYQAEDDFFKVNAFLNEADRYSKALFDTPFDRLSDPAEIKRVEEMSSAIVKNTYPTYSRVPDLIKRISRNNLIGTFVAFQAESVRCSFNIVSQALSEINSPDPRIRKIGAQRLAGITAFQAGKKTILAGSLAGTQGLIGRETDTEEQEQVRKSMTHFVPFWVKSQDAAIGIKPIISSDIYVSEYGKGKVKYTNVGASDPFGYLGRIVNRAGAGIQGEGGISDNVMVDVLIGTLIESVQPFTETDITAGTILELRENRKTSGSAIYNREVLLNAEDPEARLAEYGKILQHLGKPATPGTIRSANKIYDKATEEGGAQLLKYLLGFEEIEIDVLESFEYRMYEYKKRFSESKKSSRGDTDKGAFLRAELENKLSLEVTEMYRDALFLGADRDLLRQKLKIVFPESKITAVAAGEKPYEASDYLN